MRYPRLAPALAVLLLLIEVAFSGDGSDSDLRIVGGFPASALSTKHQVSIRRKSNDIASFGSGHTCGGSLINNHTILTAAHCLVDSRDRQLPASYFRVVGGNVNRMQVTPFTEIRDVSRVVVHEKYDPHTFNNDIGILILSAPIASDHQFFQPINLVSQTPNPGINCQTSGWGTTRFNRPEATTVLMAVNITVQPFDRCNANQSYNGSLKPGMLCAGEFAGGRDACQGDSGGPLVCNGALAGVVSHGTGCAEPNYPGIYADVAYYREWIRKNGGTENSAISVVLVFASVVYHLAQLGV